MPFTIKQQEYFKNATHRWNVKSGATRSGKTYMDYFVIPKRLRTVSGKEGLNVILGNTKGTLQRNIIEPLQKIWGSNYVSDIKSDNTAILFGEKVYCLGADKVNQVDRLRGSSIKYCYGDEVVTWHEEVFNMLKSRLDKEYSRFDGTCNPESPNHWFRKFLDSDVDIYLQEYCLDDNPYNSKEFVKNLKKEYAGTVYYDRYVLGKWVNADGAVYPFFNIDKHCFDELPQGKYLFYVSIDYGTINPCTFLLWAVDYHAKKAYLVKEYYYDSKKTIHQKTDSEYYNDLEKFCQGYNVITVVIDPSAASFKTEIRRRSKFNCTDANNAVLDGIRYTATKIQSGNILFSKNCENIINEFSGYLWDSKSLDDKAIKENDHAMDAMRYFAYKILRNSGW